MNFIRLTSAAVFVAAAMCSVVNAAVKDLPVKRVNGQLYHYYKVPDKEAVYTLCQKLDITKDEMIKHNPAVADGLKAGMILFFPVAEDVDNKARVNAASKVSGKVIKHNVERGETIFGIARKYGLTTDDVIAQNLVLKGSLLKAGQVLSLTLPGEPETDDDVAEARLPVSNADAVTISEEPQPQTKGYIVKKKETFYSIAVAHGLTVAALEAANPGVILPREGQVLNIPVSNADAQDDTSVELAENDAEDEPTDSVKSVSVAVMLPFMLNEETPSKSAMRYTEFYKGFLLAVDSLRNNGTPIHVTAYDTEASVLKVREALTDSAFNRHNIIIAPDNASQLAILAEYGKNNNVKVFNTFIVRDDSYLTNPVMVQGNMPSHIMYRKATDALLERLSYGTPVFLSFKDKQGDKADFVEEVRKALDAKGKTYMELEVDGRLTQDDLRALPTDGNYIFIPSSSRQADLNKLMPGIIEWRDKAITPLVRLFGYPEWTTFRGETLENMHNLNTTVYSRFYTDDDAPRTKVIDEAYRKWYGTRMENAVPRQGLLGFDTGMFIIPFMVSEDVITYDGVQNGYFLSRPSSESGAYNNALYFITFRPGNVIDKLRI